MKTTTVIKLFVFVLLPLLFALACLDGCTPAAGRAAKRDASTIQKQTAAADASVTRSQAANGQLAQSNAVLAQQNAQLGSNARAVQTDAERIDAKDKVLLGAKWAP